MRQGDEPDTKKSKVSMMAVGKSATSTKSLSRMRVRRASYGFGGIPGIKNVEARGSQLGLEFKRPPLLFLNTYQLDPRVRFHEATVITAAETILDMHFADHKYNVQESPAITLRLAGEIMRETKAMSFNRYRILSIVTLGQKRAQSYNNAIAFLWDHERDSYINIQRETNTAFVQVTVFGVYLD